ncbi:NAD(P)H-binding protein [Nocardia pseudovaccinii]|uniref:NAD(P)H-binding protein n=1 Tax=Nocardia pseudovaccinii TaxID=189540 RepID=UPI003D8B3420
MATPPTPRASALVIGGTGKTGRRVVERLTSRGHPVRVGALDSDPAFLWEDADTWQAALDGIDRVYITHPNITLPGAAKQVEAFARAAVAGGARRLVLLSGRGAAIAEALEEGVKNSGADWTIVRPSWFSQNFSEGFFLQAVLAGEIALPLPDAREAFIDVGDIADVVVAALIDDRHVGRTYELSGPRLLSFADVAAELSMATGREITYTPLAVEQFRGTLRKSGFPDDFAEAFAEGFVDSMDGHNAHLAHGVEEALGRMPTDFADYAREAAATGVWNA